MSTRRKCPLYPRKRTLAERTAISARRQKQTSKGRYDRRHFLLALALWRHHNCSAGDRHLGQGERRPGLTRDGPLVEVIRIVKSKRLFKTRVNTCKNCDEESKQKGPRRFRG